MNMRKGQLTIGNRETQSPVEIWGLTGGIASGKSLVARFFSEAGIVVIDADQIARQLTDDEGDASPAIQKRFGTTDRAKLREIIFLDPAARRDLEAILHPLIQAESLRRVQLLAQANPEKKLHVLYEAALLVETGRYKSLSGLIVVDAPQALRRERLLARDHCAPELADRILASQTSDDARRQAATVIFKNEGSEAELRDQVLRFIRERSW